MAFPGEVRSLDVRLQASIERSGASRKRGSNAAHWEGSRVLPTNTKIRTRVVIVSPNCFLPMSMMPIQIDGR